MGRAESETMAAADGRGWWPTETWSLTTAEATHPQGSALCVLPRPGGCVGLRCGSEVWGLSGRIDVSVVCVWGSGYYKSVSQSGVSK